MPPLLRRALTRSIPFRSPTLFSTFLLSRTFSLSSPLHHGEEEPHRISRLLDSCSTPRHLAEIHAHVLVSYLFVSHSIASKLISTAVVLRCVHVARKMFDEILQPNTFLFNTIIRSCSYSYFFSDTLNHYSRMLHCGLSPDGFTLPSVLKACASLTDLVASRAVHAHVLRFGLGEDLFTLNGVISMYAKNGYIAHACSIFDGLRIPNVVSWTAIISGSAQNGFPLNSLTKFREMIRSSVKPDFISLVSVLKASTDLEDLELGSSVHGLVIKTGFDDEIDVAIVLTSMHAKCGEIEIAKSLFDRVQKPDVILLNAMISGYLENGLFNEAVELFKKMVDGGTRPDSITARLVLSAVSQVGSMELARWVEDFLGVVTGSEFKEDVVVNTALIDMYAKCGNVARAHELFDRVRHKDVVVWSAMIAGYGFHGRLVEALELLEQMKHAGVKPNAVTFISVLSACNHTGDVDKGRKLFESMQSSEHGVEPSHQHYACMVDLLARTGRVEEAFQFVATMPIDAGVTVWGALLNACRIHGRVELGELAAARIFEMQQEHGKKNAGHYVQLSNIYASVGMWNDVSRVRLLLKHKGVDKDFGRSFVEIDGELHCFRVEDKSHPQFNCIQAMLSHLATTLKEEDPSQY